MARKYTESDGPCFARIAKNAGCRILSKSINSCGTYKCPFYKPYGYREYVRIDGEKGVALMSINEYLSRYGRGYR